MDSQQIVLIPDAQFDGEPDIEKEVAGDRIAFQVFRERSPDAIPPEVWRRCDAILVYHGMRIDAGVIDRLDKCRIIVRAGVGFDSVDLDHAARRRIPVCNTPDYGTSDVADHAVALMLALTRGLASYHDAVRADPVGAFVHAAAPNLLRLRGKTLGLIGLGRIGTATALRAKAFGMRVVAYDPYVARGHEIALGVDRVDRLEELLRDSHVVSLHAPLTTETERMLDERRLAALREGAILVNTARGELIDLDALYGALRQGRVAAAGLDVLPQEPPDPLPDLLRAYRDGEDWLRDRLIVTPHAAWKSAESRADARRKSAETVSFHLLRGELRNCVNHAQLAANAGGS